MGQIAKIINTEISQIKARINVIQRNVSGRKIFFLWAAGILPALIIFLQVSGFLLWESRAIDLSNTAPLPQYAPNAYFTRLISPLVCRMWVFPSENTVKLYEDGVILPYPNKLHTDIGEKGSGRYSFWNGDLYFSSSENSDPRDNGRTYQLVLPIPVCSVIRLGFYFFAIAATLLLIGLFYTRLRLWLLPISFGLFILLFLLSRMWFLIDFPVPGFAPDSWSYFAISDQWLSLKGGLSYTGWRPPIYPLFIMLIRLFSDNIFTVIIAQNVVSLLSGILMIYAAWRIHPWLAPGVSLSMTSFMVHDIYLSYDTTLLSESLSTNLILIAISLLLLALWSRRTDYGIATSIAISLTIMTRAAFMYLIVIYFFILIFTMLNRYPKKFLLGFTLPLPGVLLLVAYWVYLSTGTFAISTAGPYNYSLMTKLFWVEDQNYPAEINADIRNTQELYETVLTSDERLALKSSWNLKTLDQIYYKSIDGEWKHVGKEIAFNMAGGLDTAEGRYWIKRVTLDSLKKNPGGFARLVFTMLYDWYWQHPEEFSAYSIIENMILRLKTNSVTQDYPLVMVQEYGDPTKIPEQALIIQESGEIEINLTPTPNYMIFRGINRLLKTVFWGKIFTIVYFGVLIASATFLIVKRGRHLGAFFLFVLTMTNFGAALLVSISEYALWRYSYPVQFVYTLSLALLPLLFGLAKPCQEAADLQLPDQLAS